MIKINITADDVREFGDGPFALGPFQRVFPEGVVDQDWNEAFQVFLLRSEMSNLINWARHHSLIPNISLSGMYLGYGDLSRIVVTGATLFRCYLGKVKLSGSCFRMSNLEKSVLYYSDLSYSDLTCADLSCVDSTYAIMKHTNLSRVTMPYADFEGANLEEANLEGAFLKGTNFEGANLEGANLKGANLTGANLKGANLIGANLEETNCDGAIIEGAYVRRETQ